MTSPILPLLLCWPMLSHLSALELDPHGCRILSKLPKPGVHPRVFFTADEYPRMRERLNALNFKAKFDKVSTRPIFFVLTSGHIEVRLDALSESALAEEYRDALMDRLGLIKELRIPTDRNRKFFQLPPDKWVPVVGRFLEVLEEVLVVR